MRAVTFAGTGGNEVVNLAGRPDPGRALPTIDSVFPAAQAAAAFDHLAHPGKTRKVLLEFS